ncbi:PREDICTED: RNA polymerase II-associated protein 3 isoform X1 [Fragaria vesca subsp. vesca]|uniref:RNA polymerase II-associated protein 3 isoform X1 n=1 Tax=Fragaria vesca subsp. vesca TaxID=101020 RepID=UPI0002C367B1|nr:PREDICTED: RNA polymerase II-associated protein 3 isoform X1 [Fragaria vesca subsp. vesca]
MARAPSKHGRDQALDFQGFLSDLQDWELSLKDKDKKMRPQQPNKEAPKSRDFGTSSYSTNYEPMNTVSSSFTSEDGLPDAASEKDLGNEYFKQKKFKEAIDCYSRSIALTPTAVAFANRAMSYIKIKRFQEAENDCTEALNLDDRYIKAYSRRATARKELGKLKESIEDAEFALRLEPHNQEIKKQYAEAKSLYEKGILQKVSGAIKISEQDKQKVEKSGTTVNGHSIQPVSSTTQRTETTAVGDHTKKINTNGKQASKLSVQELASRAASRAKALAAENITPPSSAYQFEASWRGLSGDRALQAKLLKAISPSALPQIFKNALTVHILVDILKCVTTFFIDEMDLAVSVLENLTKVPRFDTLIMFLSSNDKADLAKIWDEVFYNEATPIEFAEKLDNLRAKYCLKR